MPASVNAKPVWHPVPKMGVYERKRILLHRHIWLGKVIPDQLVKISELHITVLRLAQQTFATFTKFE